MRKFSEAAKTAAARRHSALPDWKAQFSHFNPDHVAWRLGWFFASGTLRPRDTPSGSGGYLWRLHQVSLRGANARTKLSAHTTAPATTSTTTTRGTSSSNASNQVTIGGRGET